MNSTTYSNKTDIVLHKVATLMQIMSELTCGNYILYFESSGAIACIIKDKTISLLDIQNAVGVAIGLSGLQVRCKNRKSEFVVYIV